MRSGAYIGAVLFDKVFPVVSRVVYVTTRAVCFVRGHKWDPDAGNEWLRSGAPYRCRRCTRCFEPFVGYRDGGAS